jgi:hypothetical protein
LAVGEGLEPLSRGGSRLGRLGVGAHEVGEPCATNHSFGSSGGLALRPTLGVRKLESLRHRRGWAVWIAGAEGKVL